MAYYNEINRREDVLERGLHAIAQLLQGAADRRAEHRVYRETFAELTALSNRELADLGMHRSELKRIAHEAAKGVLHR